MQVSERHKQDPDWVLEVELKKEKVLKLSAYVDAAKGRGTYQKDKEVVRFTCNSNTIAAASAIFT